MHLWRRFRVPRDFILQVNAILQAPVIKSVYKSIVCTQCHGKANLKVWAERKGSSQATKPHKFDIRIFYNLIGINSL